MSVDEKLQNIIDKYNPLDVTIDSKTHLLTDIGMDSLSFIVFLEEVESMFNITFEIVELSSCLQVGSLVKLIRAKSKRR